MKKSEIRELKAKLLQYQQELLTAGANCNPPNEVLVRLSNQMRKATLFIDEAEYVLKNLK